MPKSRIKNAVLSIFDQKCLIWVFLAWNLQTILSYLKPAPSTKILKFGTKKSLVWVFFGWNLKTILPYLKSGTSTKLHKFGTKNACDLDIFGQELRKTLLAYLKSAPSDLSICIISRKTENV